MLVAADLNERQYRLSLNMSVAVDEYIIRSHRLLSSSRTNNWISHEIRNTFHFGAAVVLEFLREYWAKILLPGMAPIFERDPDLSSSLPHGVDCIILRECNSRLAAGLYLQPITLQYFAK
jgi:hypothetical protein